MPSNRPSSSKATALTIRPSSRASRTRSVRYSSPVAADGVRAPIRRRSQAASKAYMPALISLPASSSGVASFASTMRSTVPNSPRTTRPSSAGSAAKTLASAIAASSWRRASRTASRSAPVTSGTSPDRTRTSAASAGTTASAAPTASTGPARLVLEGEGRPDRRRRRSTAATGGEKTTIGCRPRRPVGRAGPGVEDVGQHRPAAQRVEDLGDRGLHPGAEAGRQHDGDRAARRIGTWGVHGERRRRAGLVERCSLATRAGSGANEEAVISGTGS